ncbi:pyridoxamine 5'-phosphate oxidase family protein [Yinghuangia sp. ASG 101]|uniref:pyridoxamine 5'-phosphate oxidase family protein n=1 Tax=Yinghuangia sp. ASG 101 TaxID=2896848 RepID=UPI001E43B392|nr:pyridoxamine 5'-phosphate oxidase family protein [Yinghuangia sp. ASG 101]UGQ12881.1 pyridoxamine 5'-phosphate oxidase family protein [Yinghuangia sp. ASG 101]
MTAVPDPSPPAYDRSPATTPTRYRDRMRYDADTVHAVLDDAFLAHVSFVASGQPQILPLIFGRHASRLYVHASSGSHLALAVRDAGDAGLPVSLAVTIADSVVLARSAMHHSMDFRCVVAHGPLRRVTDPDEVALGWRTMIDHLIPGRYADSRPPAPRETAQTGLFALDLVEAAAKIRSHGLSEDEADRTLDHWAGVIPLRTTAGTPRPDNGVTTEPPTYLTHWLGTHS